MRMSVSSFGNPRTYNNDGYMVWLSFETRREGRWRDQTTLVFLTFTILHRDFELRIEQSHADGGRPSPAPQTGAVLRSQRPRSSASLSATAGSLCLPVAVPQSDRRRRHAQSR